MSRSPVFPDLHILFSAGAKEHIVLFYLILRLLLFDLIGFKSMDF